ncbi:MAG TPA: hypothetical protein VH480_08975 [Streptosporangiaceae bacterium]
MTGPTSDGPATDGHDDLADREWAICCSGGGIRSAAYCLGALQSLDQGGLLAKVKWILGVSGGSYIASSRALVTSHLKAGETPHAYAPGTPEERNLRYDTRYIAPNGATVLVGVLSLLLGAICTFIIALAPAFAAGHAWGWLLREQGVLVPSGPHGMTAAVTALGWWLPSVIAAGIVFLLFLFWWATLQPTRGRPRGALLWLRADDRDRGADRAWLVSLAATIAAGLALAMLVAPLVISWLTSSKGSLGTVAHWIGFGGQPSWSYSALAALIAAVTAVARYARAGIAKWTATTTAAAGSSAAAKQGFVGQMLTRVRQLLLPYLASAVVVLLGVVLTLLWISDGARAGYSAGELIPVLAALLITVLARVFVNVNRLSMHDFYRWRLADAFAVTREAAEADAGPENRARVRELFADASATRLSQIPARETDPGLVICGTANINAVREVPPGQGGYRITFDPDHVILHRGVSLQGHEESRARTSDYEALIGYGRTTLMDVSAISGAAVSPVMGSATRHAYRLLFTATNIRLGVWIPHPNVVRDARRWIDDHQGQAGKDATDSWWARHPLLLLLWYLLPHQLWDHDGGRNRKREARLWAHVLELRLRERKRGAVWYRFMQPTLGLLWAEAAGQLSYRATWMYVTDGGHYDNLGLVEALRRGAKNILVLDASGDKADTWFTLGGAIALARSDAGVDIQLNPTTMTQGGRSLAPGQVVRPWAYGTFRRLQEDSGSGPPKPQPGGCDPLDDPTPEPASQPAQQGNIWVCKLGWWSGAPWDVRAYAKHHPTYPCDPTLEQLYDSNEFSAYQELGAATVRDAAKPPATAPGKKPFPPPLPLQFGGPATNGDALSSAVTRAQGPVVPVKEKT